MPRPGVDVEIVEAFTAGEAVLDTSQGMFAGYTERGAPLTVVHSMTDYRNKCGGRNGASKMYDNVSSFFQEAGGGTAYIARNSTAAGAESAGSLGTWADFAAKSQGLWGDDVDVTSRAGLGTGSAIRLEIKYKGDIVETSPNLADIAAATSWANKKSAYVNIVGEGADSDTLPAAATTVALAGGADGAKASADYQSGLDLLKFDLGPGQVNAPGEIDPTVQLMVGQHIADNHRVGVVDFEDTDDPTALLSAVGNLYGQPGCNQMIGMGNWLEYPADASPATIIVPFSGVEMGMIARIDRLGDPSLVAAGARGISRRALGLTNVFSDADHQALNAAGVALGREMYNNVRMYGYRTVAGPDETNWLFFQEARVIMNVAHRSAAQLEEYVFNTMDGLRHLYTKIKNAIVGVCLPFWVSGALYGGTPDEAFKVVCDDSNNTDDTIALGEAHVTLFLRTSKIAEWIKVEIIKVPTDVEVPA